MKSILLLRHGKSAWNADFDRDHDRPLASRGEDAARMVGRLMTSGVLQPDVVLTSTAVRARDTVRIASQEADWRDVPIQEHGELYGGEPATILRLVHGLSDRYDTVLVAGHEPGWSHAVSAFSGGSRVEMPTACLARIEFAVGRWEACQAGRGVLTHLIPPKALR